MHRIFHRCLKRYLRLFFVSQPLYHEPRSEEEDVLKYEPIVIMTSEEVTDVARLGSDINSLFGRTWWMRTSRKNIVLACEARVFSPRDILFELAERTTRVRGSNPCTKKPISFCPRQAWGCGSESPMRHRRLLRRTPTFSAVALPSIVRPDTNRKTPF